MLARARLWARRASLASRTGVGSAAGAGGLLVVPCAILERGGPLSRSDEILTTGAPLEQWQVMHHAIENFWHANAPDACIVGVREQSPHWRIFKDPKIRPCLPGLDAEIERLGSQDVAVSVSARCTVHELACPKGRLVDARPGWLGVPEPARIHRSSWTLGRCVRTPALSRGPSKVVPATPRRARRERLYKRTAPVAQSERSQGILAIVIKYTSLGGATRGSLRGQCAGYGQRAFRCVYIRNRGSEPCISQESGTGLCAARHPAGRLL